MPICPVEELKVKIIDLLLPENRDVDLNVIESVLDIVRAEIKFRHENGLRHGHGEIHDNSKKLDCPVGFFSCVKR